MIDINSILEGIDISHFEQSVPKMSEIEARTVSGSRDDSELCGLEIFKPLPMTMSEKRFWIKSQLSDRYHVDFTLENEVYHAHNYLSSSKLLKVKGKTEIEAKKLINTPVVSTAAMKRGTALHDVIEQMVLTGLTTGDLSNYLSSFHIAPKINRASKKSVIAAIEFFQQFFTEPQLLEIQQLEASNDFMTMKMQLDEMQRRSVLVVENDIADAIVGLIAEFKRLPHVYKLLMQSVPELSLFDNETKQRIRPDNFIPKPVYGKNIHVSLKTTGDMSIYEKQRHRYNNAQTGMYATILDQAFGDDVLQIVVIIEIKGPLVQIKIQEFSSPVVAEFQHEYLQTLEYYDKVIGTEQEALKGYEGMYKNNFGVDVI